MVSRLGRVTRGGWITFGIVVGAIIGPGVALAAFSDVRIVGVGGSQPAEITGANQLQVGEVDPRRIKRFNVLLIPRLGCRATDVPAGASLMLKQVVINVFRNERPADGDRVYIYANKTCNDDYGGRIVSVTPQGIRTTMTIPFEPGVALPSGGGFSINAGDNILGEVYVLGYTMPSGALPIRLGK